MNAFISFHWSFLNRQFSYSLLCNFLLLFFRLLFQEIFIPTFGSIFGLKKQQNPKCNKSSKVK